MINLNISKKESLINTSQPPILHSHSLLPMSGLLFLAVLAGTFGNSYVLQVLPQLSSDILKKYVETLCVITILLSTVDNHLHHNYFFQSELNKTIICFSIFNLIFIIGMEYLKGAITRY